VRATKPAYPPTHSYSASAALRLIVVSWIEIYRAEKFENTLLTVSLNVFIQCRSDRFSFRSMSAHPARLFY
jgi:hypothetical protein